MSETDVALRLSKLSTRGGDIWKKILDICALILYNVLYDDPEPNSTMMLPD